MITNYNHNFAGQPTPAGQALHHQRFVHSARNCPALGGVQQPIPAAPHDEAGMGWLRAFDVSLNWVYKFREKFEVQPGVSFFNVMNFVEF